MSINVDALITAMLETNKEVLTEELSEAAPYFQKALKDESEIIKRMIELRLSGKLSDEEFISELEDEKKVIEAQILMAGVAAKSAVQKAVNSSFDILYNTVKMMI